MSKVFLIGDTHFDDKNIIKFCDRPYRDVQDMNEHLIENWNRVVGKDDIVFHFGDFAVNRDTSPTTITDFIECVSDKKSFDPFPDPFPKTKTVISPIYYTPETLNGEKRLIRGNHDDLSLEAYFKMGFKYVYDYPILYDEFYIFSHEPQHVQMHSMYANIFAHVHNNPMYRDVSSRTFCVSSERINDTPIEWEIVKQAMRNYGK